MSCKPDLCLYACICLLLSCNIGQHGSAWSLLTGNNSLGPEAMIFPDICLLNPLFLKLEVLETRLSAFTQHVHHFYQKTSKQAITADIWNNRFWSSLPFYNITQLLKLFKAVSAQHVYPSFACRWQGIKMALLCRFMLQWFPHQLPTVFFKLQHTVAQTLFNLRFF